MQRALDRRGFAVTTAADAEDEDEPAMVVMEGVDFLSVLAFRASGERGGVGCWSKKMKRARKVTVVISSLALYKRFFTAVVAGVAVGVATWRVKRVGGRGLRRHDRWTSQFTHDVIMYPRFSGG